MHPRRRSGERPFAGTDLIRQIEQCRRSRQTITPISTVELLTAAAEKAAEKCADLDALPRAARDRPATFFHRPTCCPL
jgi:hypothetical protein